MEVLLWTVTLILGVPSALLILLNWLGLIGWALSSRREHKGGYSFAPPFLCGVAGAIACFTCPSPGVWRWAWVPPLIDPSIGLLVFASLLHLVARGAGLRSPFDREPSRPPEE